MAPVPPPLAPAPASLHANAHGPSRALLVPIEGKVVEGFVRARHGVQVVVDVVPVAQGVPPPPQREVGVLKEQRAIQHNLLVDLGPENEDLHAAGHDAGVDVLLVVVVAKRETQDDRTRTSTLHLFFLNTDKSASDRDSLLQGHQDNSNFYITPLLSQH